MTRDEIREAVRTARVRFGEPDERAEMYFYDRQCGDDAEIGCALPGGTEMVTHEYWSCSVDVRGMLRDEASEIRAALDAMPTSEWKWRVRDSEGYFWSGRADYAVIRISDAPQDAPSSMVSHAACLVRHGLETRYVREAT